MRSIHKQQNNINITQLSYFLTGLPSSYRQSRVLGSSTSDLLSTQSSSTNIAAPFGIFFHLYALLTVSLVLGLSSRLRMFARHL